MSDVFHFLGGPMHGKTIAVPPHSWPFQAHEMLPGGHGIGVGGLEGWAPAYRTEYYYPVRWEDGTQFAVTEDHLRRAKASEGLDEALLKSFALERLYNAITGDHNDPTDESESELEAALAMAEKLISAPVVEREVPSDASEIVKRILGG